MAKLKEHLDTLNFACNGVKFTNVELRYDAEKDNYKVITEFRLVNSLPRKSVVVVDVSEYEASLYSNKDIEDYILDKSYMEIYNFVQRIKNGY